MNIKEYIQGSLPYDKPVDYLGIVVYPVKVKDYADFLSVLDIINIDKNRISNIDIIKMSYLQFMLALILEDETWKNKFIKLFELCFHIYSDDSKKIDDNKFEKDVLLEQTLQNGDVLIILNGRDIYFKITSDKKVLLYINNCKVNGTEFDNIMDIIKYQNIINYDNEFVSDDVKQVVSDYYAIKNKGIKQPSIEDKITHILAHSSIPVSEIFELSCRRFEMVFQSIVDKTDYIVMSIAQIQGALKKGETVPHWAYKPDKEKFADVFTAPETITDKF